jgi:hypothetical protein
VATVEACTKSLANTHELLSRSRCRLELPADSTTIDDFFEQSRDPQKHVLPSDEAEPRAKTAK